MRLGIIIARRKGARTFEVLAGPEIPLPDQIQGFKELQAGEAGDLEEIQLWNSSQGRARRHIFTGNPGINKVAILPPEKQKHVVHKPKQKHDGPKSHSQPQSSDGDKKPAGEQLKGPVGMQAVLLPNVPGGGNVQPLPPLPPDSGGRTEDPETSTSEKSQTQS